MNKLPGYFLVFVLLMSTAINTNAQHLEAGLTGGVTNYGGDLQAKALELNTVRYSVNAFVRYNLNYRWSARTQFSYVPLRGSDQYNYRFSGNFQRNLSFQSDVLELSAVAEYNLMKFNPSEKLTTTIYVFGGIAGFHHNPKALFNGEWVELRELGTEGQLVDNSVYSKVGFAIPAGIGVKLALNERISLSAEANFRKTFTDYIDDVSTTYPDFAQTGQINAMTEALSNRSLGSGSGPINKAPSSDLAGRQRGNPDVDDYYYSFDFGVSYKIGERKDLLFDKKMVPFFK